MYSTVEGTGQVKARKGEASIEMFRGRLRVRLPREIDGDGKQKYLSLGLYDDEEGWIKAQAKLIDINSDIRSGEYNSNSLIEKYKKQRILTTAPSDGKAINLLELMKAYYETKKPVISPGTFRNNFQIMLNRLEKCPFKSVEDAQRIKDWSLANLRPNSAKRFISNLSATCKWARSCGYVKENPFDGMTEGMKGKDKDKDARPFSKEERDAIYQALEKNKHYSYYLPLIKFLFLTGCRPSEAIGLQWRHIKSNTIKFEQAVVIGEQGLVLKDGCKTTNSTRDFPINSQLRELLDSIKSERRTNELVFKPKGERKGKGTNGRAEYINRNNLGNRLWKTILREALEILEGRDVTEEEYQVFYRKLYQTRHTFISQQLENGVSQAALAKVCGTSMEMIQRHYGGTIKHIQLPEM